MLGPRALVKKGPPTANFVEWWSRHVSRPPPPPEGTPSSLPTLTISLLPSPSLFSYRHSRAVAVSGPPQSHASSIPNLDIIITTAVTSLHVRNSS